MSTIPHLMTRCQTDWTLYLTFLHTCVLFSFAATNEVGLRRLLFDQRPYDQNVCPERGVTRVYTNLILLQIESVDEKAQVRSARLSSCRTLLGEV